MEQFLIGLRDFAIEKVVSRTPPVFEARWTGKNTCPHCAGEKLRIKDSFWRTIRNISILEGRHACWFAATNTDAKNAVDILIPDLQA